MKTGLIPVTRHNCFVSLPTLQDVLLGPSGSSLSLGYHGVVSQAEYFLQQSTLREREEFEC